MRTPNAPAVTADLTGFTSVSIVAIDPSAGSTQASGTFDYRMVGGALEWYVSASGLERGRAYRIVLSAADGNEYAVASQRAQADGALSAHGVETELYNKECVGMEDPSHRPLQTTTTVTILVKKDGSTGGTWSNDLVGSRSALPCHGNGDGDFGYVLKARSAIVIRP